MAACKFCGGSVFNTLSNDDSPCNNCQQQELKAEIDKLLCFISREGYQKCDIAACNCGSFHDHRIHVKLDKLEAEKVRLCKILETVLMKLEDYHKYAEPERNAFIENMPIHIRATLKECE